MSATTKPVAGPVRTRDGGFQSSRTLARQYAFWIDRFQHFSGPTFIARAKRALPTVSFDSTVVAMALTMQRRRDKELREQGTRGLTSSPKPGTTSPATTWPYSGWPCRTSNRPPSR